MPIFYNSEDHVKFIQVVKNFKPLDEDIFYDHLILKDEDIYGFNIGGIKFLMLHSIMSIFVGVGLIIGMPILMDCPIILDVFIIIFHEG